MEWEIGECLWAAVTTSSHRHSLRHLFTLFPFAAHTSYRSFDPRFNDYLSNIYYKIVEPVSSHDHQLPFVAAHSAAPAADHLGDRSSLCIRMPITIMILFVFCLVRMGEMGERGAVVVQCSVTFCVSRRRVRQHVHRQQRLIRHASHLISITFPLFAPRRTINFS